MSAKDLKTLSYSGSGTTFSQPSSRAWPKLNYSSFSRLLDWDNAALREEFARSQIQPPGRRRRAVIELCAADDPISDSDSDLSCCCHF